MLDHYSPIRMAAKRAALDAIAQKQAEIPAGVHQNVHQLERGAFKGSLTCPRFLHQS